MTLMRIRQVVPCAQHNRVIIVLEDAAGRQALTFYADPEEARRLAREIARGRRVCHPIYDFVHGLRHALQAAATRVVLEDVNGSGIGSVVISGMPSQRSGSDAIHRTLSHSLSAVGCPSMPLARPDPRRAAATPSGYRASARRAPAVAREPEAQRLLVARRRPGHVRRRPSLARLPRHRAGYRVTATLHYSAQGERA
jgi:hypothetical protein